MNNNARTRETHGKALAIQRGLSVPGKVDKTLKNTKK